MIKVFPFNFYFLFRGKINSFCSRMSRSPFNLSCKPFGAYVAHYFLKTVSSLIVRCSSECIFPTLNFDVA